MRPDFLLEFRFKTLWKWIPLKLLSLIYTLGIQTWLAFYRIGWKKAVKVDCPVISIGNITVGGTGKTPMVDWCLDFCKEYGKKAVVITRGYKGEREDKREVVLLNQETAKQLSPQQVGDEPWLLFTRHPDCEFYITSDRRVAAGRVKDADTVLFLDDGMQHLKLHRDLNIVLIDSITGIGNGHILPLGPLREPIQGLSRADTIIFSRTNIKDSQWIREKLKPLVVDIPMFDAQYRPGALISSKSGNQTEVTELAGKSVLLFSGIGNPDAFTSIIDQQGGVVTGHMVLEDHVQYDEKLIEKITTFCSDQSEDTVYVTTEKDWVKLEAWKERLPEIYYLKMEMTLGEDFNQYLTRFFDHWFSSRLP